MFEIALPFKGDAFRVVCAVQLSQEIWVVHAFQKKSTAGSKTPSREIEMVRNRLKHLKRDVLMRGKKELEVVRGSGNVFGDLGRNNAEAEQFKAILAKEIIQVLDRE